MHAHHSRRSILVAAIMILSAPTLVMPVAAQDATGTPPMASAVVVAGSATVGPILQGAAEALAARMPGIEVAVERSNSGAGIERFCHGETDVATSGRRIKGVEAAACAAAGVAYEEFEVAFDGIAVVVNPANDAVSCLTAKQLGQLWEPGSAVGAWQDLDPAWPAERIALYGTGSESGTYQFFTQAVVGEEGASRDDYEVTDGHPATADRVAADANGLGFLPYPRYIEHQERLQLVAVDGENGCVSPSAETIRDGSYAPLSRPLYLYTNRTSLSRPEVAEFLRFYFANAADFAEGVGLVASDEDLYAANRTRLEAAVAETSTANSLTMLATPAA